MPRTALPSLWTSLKNALRYWARLYTHFTDEETEACAAQLVSHTPNLGTSESGDPATVFSSSEAHQLTADD